MFIYRDRWVIMPIYEYECVDCSLHFDKRTQFENMNLAVACPKCGGNGNKQLSVFASLSTTSSQDNSYVQAQSPTSGGCCGGGCCGN